MTDDRLSGSAKNIGGQVEEEFGQVTGDVKTQLRPSRWRARYRTSTARPRRLRLMPLKLPSLPLPPKVRPRTDSSMKQIRWVVVLAQK